MTCPHCGGGIESQQVRAARARWAKREAPVSEKPAWLEPVPAARPEVRVSLGPCPECRCPAGGVRVPLVCRLPPGRCGCHR